MFENYKCNFEIYKWRRIQNSINLKDFLLGEANIEAKATEDKNRPKNRIEIVFDWAINIQPKAAMGENIINVFFRPNHPDKAPPKGANTIRQNKSIEANHELSFSLSFSWGNATVAKPNKIPSEAVTKLTVNAPIT